MTTALSNRSKRLAELTDTIQRGLSTFIEVGRALLEVRQDRLWSDGWESFDSWCQDVHGFGKTYASRLITASQQAEELPSGQQPANERQAREARRKPKDEPEEQREQESEAPDTSGAGTESPTPPADGDPAGVHVDRVEWVVVRIGWLWDKYNATFGDRAERFAFVAGLEHWQIRSET